MAVMADTEPPSPKRYVVKFNLNFDLDNPDAEGEPQTIYEMDTPIARQVADLLAIQHDLMFVQDACSMLLSLPVDDDGARLVLARSLWSSALVAYVRCFAGGVRRGLKEADVKRIPGNPIAIHRALKAVRDKHVAHSVNPMEVIKIGVMVGDEEERINGWTQITVAHWETDPRNAVNLYRLAEGLLAVVKQRLDKATPVLDKTTKDIDLNTIKTWPQVTYERIDYDPAGDRRS